MFRVLSLLLILSAGFMLSVSTPASAQEKAPKATSYKVQLSKLPKHVRQFIFQQIAKHGVKPTGEETLSASTDRCPSNCNDSVGGGFCFCKPGSDGECPDDTTAGGTPDEPYCKVEIPKAEVIGGGLRRPLEVVMP